MVTLESFVIAIYGQSQIFDIYLLRKLRNTRWFIDFSPVADSEESFKQDQSSCLHTRSPLSMVDKVTVPASLDPCRLFILGFVSVLEEP